MIKNSIEKKNIKRQHSLNAHISGARGKQVSQLELLGRVMLVMYLRDNTRSYSWYWQYSQKNQNIWKKENAHMIIWFIFHTESFFKLGLVILYETSSSLHPYIGCIFIVY